MSQKPKISVLVSTYNWPEALTLVLKALNEQSYHNFEVVVADDGSTESTQLAIEKLQPDYRIPLRHIWHEDQGFRLSAIRNKAIQATEGEYLIFLDGDCIPRKDFIEQHANLAESGRFVTGNRVLLSESFTSTVLAEQIPVQIYSMAEWFIHRLRGNINRLLPLITLPLKKWRTRNQTKWRRAIGCNIAAWKSDLITINGFDEDFVGWGYEDSDLVIRLIKSGIFRKEGRYATGVLHLWHPEAAKNIKNSNLERLHQTQNSEKTIINNGINKLS